MAERETSNAAWFEDVRTFTERLVGIRSVSPGAGENAAASEVLRMLGESGLHGTYTELGLDALEGDPHGRHNVYAFLRGASPRTVVLLGHIDTVDTADYGELEPWALDPHALAQRTAKIAEMSPGVARDMEMNPDDWMFGRGTADMKAGVAINIAVMRRLAELARGGRLPLSVVMLATPDEENESAGVLQGVRFLLRLRERHGLEYLGAINTDYTTALHPGDPHRYVYMGTVGKLLPSFLVIGRESHVGDPFNGLDANLLAAELIRDLSMNDTLCDFVRGQCTAPPVTLHATDLKTSYDVQLPFAAYFYLNVLTFSTTPGELLERLRHIAEAAVARVLCRVDETERRWLASAGDGARALRLVPRSGRVVSYAELRAEAIARVGAAAVANALEEEWARWPADTDKRERSLRLVYRLWRVAGISGPAVVLYYSPPFYPHVAAASSDLHDAVAAVASAHPELRLKQEEYFPFLSDMSYLRLDPDIEIGALVANMPAWAEVDGQPRAGGYALPFDAIRALNLPVVNLGPYGAGAHQRGERLLMSYSFGVVPQLVYQTIQRLARGD